MDKTRILFVDDNQDILDGLSRAMRHENHRWDMSFIKSGEEALEFMAARKVDAVVTDVRMPGIDGVQLLHEIAKLYPYVVRFILSGHSQEEITLQAAKLAHQFFPKPCDIDDLKAALVRSLSLRELLSDNKLRSVVSGVASLPSLPKVYSEIVEKLNSPEVTVHEIGETISNDPAISAKILQLVNSAFFGVGRRISSAGEAATLLGLDAIKQLVLSVELFSQFDEQKLNCTGFILDELVEHSIRVGLLAKQIAISEHAEKKIIEESYLSGFLHDVGKLILVDNMPDEYKQVVELEQTEQIDTYVAEREIFGTEHGSVGAYLLGLWGFADTVLEAIAFHHFPNRVEAIKFSPLTAIHVANFLDNTQTGNGDDSGLERIDSEYLSRLKLENHLPTWKSLCEQAGEK
jgi:HD-like signal output (HDOD) protein